MLSETVCGVRRRALGGRSAGRVPQSPPLVRQIKRWCGTGNKCQIFLSHCVGSHQYDPSEWYASLQKRAHCDWALVAPLQSAGPHSAPLPTGTPPTLMVLIAWLRSVRLRPSVLRQVLLRGVSQGRCRLRRLPLGRTRLRLYALRSCALRLDRVRVFPSSLPPVPVRLGAVRARGQKKVTGARPGDLGVTNSSTLPLSYSASYKFSLRCSCVSVLCAMVPMPFVRRGPRLL